MEDAREVNWQDNAACRGQDTNLFFPENSAKPTEALAFCAVCEVKRECLDFALSWQIEHGVWGGMTRFQRTQIRRAELSRTCKECGRRLTGDRRGIYCTRACQQKAWTERTGYPWRKSI